MKLFLDDLRDPPDTSWVLARSTREALEICRETWPTELALDHDLGGDDTVMIFLKSLYEMSEDKPIPSWKIHSANPAGRLNIESFMMSWEKSRK
jgi:hypothetical protein